MLQRQSYNRRNLGKMGASHVIFPVTTDDTDASRDVRV